MGGLLDFLSPGLTVATQAAGAQQAGEAQKAATDQANTLKMIAQLRQQHEDEQKDLLTRAQVGNLESETKARLAPPPKANTIVPQGSTVLGPDNKPLFTAPKTESAKTLSPDFVTGNGQPVMVQDGNFFDGAGNPVSPEKVHRYVAPQAPSPAQLIDIPDPAHPGQTIKAWADPRSRTISPTTQTGFPKGAGAGGGAGGAEQVKKAEQLGLALNSLKDAIPTMEARGFKSPNFATGPLSAEASKPGFMGEVAAGGVNLLDPSQSDLNGAMDLFLSAAAHSVGGARITPEQINKFTSGYKGRTNDAPALVEKKLRRAVDFLNAAASVLPPDMVAKQHQSIDPASMKLLQKYGYGQPPSAEAMGQVQALQSETGNTNSPASAGTVGNGTFTYGGKTYQTSKTP